MKNFSRLNGHSREFNSFFFQVYYILFYLLNVIELKNGVQISNIYSFYHLWPMNGYAKWIDYFIDK